jgi:hypothetical protein
VDLASSTYIQWFKYKLWLSNTPSVGGEPFPSLLYQYKIQLFASLKKSFVITHRKDNRLVTVREGIKPDLA